MVLSHVFAPSIDGPRGDLELSSQKLRWSIRQESDFVGLQPSDLPDVRWIGSAPKVLSLFWGMSSPDTGLLGLGCPVQAHDLDWAGGTDSLGL